MDTQEKIIQVLQLNDVPYEEMSARYKKAAALFRDALTKDVGISVPPFIESTTLFRYVQRLTQEQSYTWAYEAICIIAKELENLPPSQATADKIDAIYQDLTLRFPIKNIFDLP